MRRPRSLLRRRGLGQMEASSMPALWNTAQRGAGPERGRTAEPAGGDDGDYIYDHK